MKKLKKLQLKKETIANLNDHEMNLVKGGSSYVCSVISAVSATVASVVESYNYGEDQSWWGCEPQQPSERIITDQDGNQHCLISDVYGYGMG
ncbi:MAG: class I lanthipeptide [Mangrovibacterium sp.]